MSGPWHKRNVKDWFQYGDCDEDCGAKSGEPCMSPKRSKEKGWGGRRKRATAHLYRPKIMDVYPEHAKLTAISETTQEIRNFLGWMNVERNSWLTDDDGRPLTDEALDRLLLKFYGISEDELETERKKLWGGRDGPDD